MVAMRSRMDSGQKMVSRERRMVATMMDELLPAVVDVMGKAWMRDALHAVLEPVHLAVFYLRGEYLRAGDRAARIRYVCKGEMIDLTLK
jgi:hypothetical protein